MDKITQWQDGDVLNASDLNGNFQSLLDALTSMTDAQVAQNAGIKQTKIQGQLGSNDSLSEDILQLYNASQRSEDDSAFKSVLGPTDYNVVVTNAADDIIVGEDAVYYIQGQAHNTNSMASRTFNMSDPDNIYALRAAYGNNATVSWTLESIAGNIAATSSEEWDVCNRVASTSDMEEDYGGGDLVCVGFTISDGSLSGNTLVATDLIGATIYWAVGGTWHQARVAYCLSGGAGKLDLYLENADTAYDSTYPAEGDAVFIHFDKGTLYQDIPGTLGGISSPTNMLCAIVLYDGSTANILRAKNTIDFAKATGVYSSGWTVVGPFSTGTKRTTLDTAYAGVPGCGGQPKYYLEVAAISKATNCNGDAIPRSAKFWYGGVDYYRQYAQVSVSPVIVFQETRLRVAADGGRVIVDANAAMLHRPGASPSFASSPPNWSTFYSYVDYIAYKVVVEIL